MAAGPGQEALPQKNRADSGQGGNRKKGSHKKRSLLSAKVPAEQRMEGRIPLGFGDQGGGRRSNKRNLIRSNTNVRDELATLPNGNSQMARKSSHCKQEEPKALVGSEIMWGGVGGEGKGPNIRRGYDPAEGTRNKKGELKNSVSWWYRNNKAEANREG